MTSSLRTWIWALFLAVVFGATLPTPALPQTYVRGGLLLDWGDDTRFQDRNCSSQDPAALYGCGTGNDGAPLSSRGDFGAIPGLELGVGYVMLPYLRLEAGMQYRPDFSFGGRANFTQPEPDARQDVSAELSSLSGMLAAYLVLVNGSCSITRLSGRSSVSAAVCRGLKSAKRAWTLKIPRPSCREGVT